MAHATGAGSLERAQQNIQRHRDRNGRTVGNSMSLVTTSIHEATHVKISAPVPHTVAETGAKFYATDITVTMEDGTVHVLSPLGRAPPTIDMLGRKPK